MICVYICVMGYESYQKIATKAQYLRTFMELMLRRSSALLIFEAYFPIQNLDLMLKSWISVLLFCVFSLSFVAAQSFYTVQIGTFLNPKLDDFESVRSLGYIYAQPTNSDIYRIYLGGYETRSKAETLVSSLKRQGYLDAAVVERDLTRGESIPVVQLATKNMEDEVDWERYLQFDRLFVLFENNQLKIVTGPFRNLDDAKFQLPTIRQAGFDDAFAKTANSLRMHEVTNFELGDAKRPLIPLTLNERGRTPTGEFVTRGGGNQPAEYGATGGRIDVTDAPSSSSGMSAAPALPEIRTNVKRHSALELQKVLKKLQTYSGSLDGYYGNGTMGAYEEAVKKNEEFLKYAVLARYMQQPESTGSDTRLQTAINNLYSNTNAALATLQGSNQAIAKAYLAYWNYVSQGRSQRVNNLMNAAIQQAFRDVTVRPNGMPFDPTATYAYNDLGQLILHLRYVQAAEANEPAVPCWLFERHPEEAVRAFEPQENFAAQSYRVQNCMGFDNWEIIKILKTIAADMNSNSTLNERRLAEAASYRSRLFLVPKPLSASDEEALKSWDARLWQNLEGWATRDPLHEDLVTALKLAYYQAQVLVEDHYMNEGFSENEAKGLALAVLQTLVEYHLERFV